MSVHVNRDAKFAQGCRFAARACRWSRKQQRSLSFFLPRTRAIVTPMCDPALGGNGSQGLRLTVTDKFSAQGSCP